MFKKATALLLSAIMTIAMLVGCGGSNSDNSNANASSDGNTDSTAGAPDKEVNPYEEKVSFTILSLDDSDDYMSWPQVKDAKEKFNVDFEIQQVAWDNWDETTRTLAATDSLPEILGWYNLSYSEYLSWVKEGVFKALPDDMSVYPNLKKIIDTHDIFKNITVDGKLYAFPKISNNNPYNSYAPNLFIYRKDWTTKMGKDFEPVQDMTWDEFTAFLEELKKADPAKLGDKLVPFDLEHGGLSWGSLVKQFNPDMGYIKSSGSYTWGTDSPATLDGIKKIKELYDSGLLAKDSYADKNEMGQERFYAGRSAVINGPYGPALLAEVTKRVAENCEGFKDTDLGLISLKVNEKYQVEQMSEWWAASAFSSKCTDEQMNRFLAIGNWLLSEEQIENYAYGIPETDWTKDTSGKVTLNYSLDDTTTGKPKAYIADQRIFQKLFILEGLETWLPGNPLVSSYLVNDLFETHIKRLEEAPNYRPMDYDYSFFTGPNKDQYGDLTQQTNEAIIQAVVSKDPEKVWNDFLAINRPTAQLVIDELNAAGLGIKK